MSKNKLNKPEEEKPVEEVVEPAHEERHEERHEEHQESEHHQKGTSQSSLWKKWFRGDALGGSFLRRQLKLILMIVLCLIVIVTMRYKVEELQKEKIATETRIGVLREHKIQMQKQYQESVKISRIEKKLDTLGVGLISGPPYAIGD